MKLRNLLAAVSLAACSLPLAATAGNPVTMATKQLAVYTDKCMYAPGEAVGFTLDAKLPAGAMVRYRRGATVVGGEQLTATTWTWTAPETDFTGYMADIYTTGDDGSETIHATIGVDVSSSWAKYPRYGFVATYDGSKSTKTVAAEIKNLNRYHINGVQFYDWHYRHHKPLAGTREAPLSYYKDIANRGVFQRSINNYISAQHQYGMKAMFYNLLYGAQPEATEEGVSEEWGLYCDSKHAERDKHTLPSDWQGPIYLCNPANTLWQQYLAERNDDVYAVYDFDGFHIDQLGGRGTRYDYNGKTVNLTAGYSSFINAMKQAHPDKKLVMNAVSNYGSDAILSTGNVEFAYTEMWAGEGNFSNIETITKAHGASPYRLSTVLAAYMNYDKASGNFNTPGILLTDATMFAVGASHLELGDHMLCSEYFPTSKLAMTSQLTTALTKYYDFLVGYEQYLRGNGDVADVEVSSTSSKVSINSWPPVKGKVAAYARQLGSAKVVNFLNYSAADNLSWRDLEGTMPEPSTLTAVPVRLKVSDVSGVWAATPDTLGCLPVALEYTTDGDYITFNIPSLKYWTMVVVEQGARRPMVVGEAVWGNWSTENSCVMVPVEGKSGVYQYTGYFEADKEFKFLTKNDWGDEYRNANASTPYVDSIAKIRYGGGDDNKFKVRESANYTATIDLNNMTLTMEKAAYQDNQILHNVLYLIGDATPAGWNLIDAVEMKQDSQNPFLFTTNVYLTSTGDFKIAVNNHASWGQRFYHPESGDLGKITDDGTDDRKWTVSKNGYYSVSVDLLAQTITFEDITAIESTRAHSAATLRYNSEAATVEYEAGAGKTAALAIFDAAGREIVRTSVSGSGSISAADALKSAVPGTYFATLTAPGSAKAIATVKFVVK